MTKRKFSVVWNHFTEMNEGKRAKCKYCSALISIAGGSNGNLSRHIKTKHIRVRQALERQKSLTAPFQNKPIQSKVDEEEPTKVSTTNQQILNPSIFEVQEIDKQVVKMITRGHHALRMVDEPEMRKLIEMVSLSPGYSLPNRKTLSKHLIPTIHNELITNVRNEIAATTALSLTTDSWTSSTNESYMAVTAHFIDAETQLCSALLACEAIQDKPTSQDICSFLREIIEKWNLQNKVSAVVSDNSANTIEGVRLGGWQSIACFAQLLNIVVQNALKEMMEVLVRVRRIVKYFNQSSQEQRKLIASLQQISLTVMKLKQDVPTRWNSTYDMLDRFVQEKDDVITFSSTKPDLHLTEDEWGIIIGVLPLLKPFYELTMEISAEKNVTLSKTVVFCNLIGKFLSRFHTRNETVSKVHMALKTGMQSQFKDLENNVLYGECTVLDPRFKHKGFNNKNTYNNIVECLRNQFAHPESTQEDIKPDFASLSMAGSDVNMEKQVSIWDEYDENMKSVIGSDDKLAAATRELDKYLSEEFLDRKKDPLEWWRERKQIYPMLYEYILKRFCIVATSVPCERVFSAAGQIINQRRTLLKSSNVSELIFLHSNM